MRAAECLCPPSTLLCPEQAGDTVDWLELREADVKRPQGGSCSAAGLDTQGDGREKGGRLFEGAWSTDGIWHVSGVL